MCIRDRSTWAFPEKVVENLERNLEQYAREQANAFDFGDIFDLYEKTLLTVEDKLLSDENRFLRILKEGKVHEEITHIAERCKKEIVRALIAAGGPLPTPSHDIPFNIAVSVNEVQEMQKKVVKAARFDVELVWHDENRMEPVLQKAHFWRCCGDKDAISGPTLREGTRVILREQLPLKLAGQTLSRILVTALLQKFMLIRVNEGGLEDGYHSWLVGAGRFHRSE
eukprot:TRINITY_DN12057_c0_g1_i1.p1 TRINITY_DN12057_c0_g1~~TRINITY_DN12057_c0_g1_i1.p1  ORF type:complete len:244 (-),score=36.70 TRINITY_DN12057_c0_g1_i1:59-733(-)